MKLAMAKGTAETLRLFLAKTNTDVFHWW